MSYAYIDCQPHAHTMELKQCVRCRREAHNTLHYEELCQHFCDKHKPAKDRHGRPVEWQG